MSRTVQIGVFALIALSFPFGGCSPVLRAVEPPPAHVALPALRGTDGKAVVPFVDKDAKAVVVAVLSFKCPVSRDYVEPLSKMVAEYKAKGVVVIGIVPNATAEAVAKHAAEFKPGFPVCADCDLRAADALGAGHTPEVFVLDADRAVRYRGRIDDKYGERLKPNARITRHDLREALNELLAGKPVSVPKTDCVGCEIYRPKAGPKPDAKVTFYRDVLPILQNRCQECHRPGEAGPFPLLAYDDAVTWASDIKEYTRSRKMPPWKQSAGMAFLHDRRMPASEIATLAEWADGGTPEGNPKDAPPAKKFTTGWALGEPDLVLTPDDAFRLAGRGPDHYRCFVLPTGLTEDKFLVGYEVRPGTAAVVHHVLNFFDTSGTARQLDRAARQKANAGEDRGPGYESSMGIGFAPKDPSQVGGFGGWAPGVGAQKARPGTGFLLPKGSDVVLQIHYHRDGKPTTDRTKIGLYFANGSGAKDLQRLKSLRVPGQFAASADYAPFTAIPAGASGFRVVGKVVVDEDCRLYAAMPHMHMLGSKTRITLTPPSGKEQVIVAIDEWDYGWQEVYRLVNPLDVAAGTVFTIEAEFDNSAKNRLNPNLPPKEVKRGEGTTDEMLIGFLSVTSKSAGGEVKARPLTEKSEYAVRVPDVIYGRKDGTALTMDVFRPIEKANRAGVILLASSGYISSPEVMDPKYTQQLLHRGYTVFYTQHGSSPRYTVPEARDDVRRAVRFVRHSAGEYGIDPDRVALVGASSGGNLALLVATDPLDGDLAAADPVERVACMVAAAGVFFPPTDYLNYFGPGRALDSEPIPAKYRPAFDFKVFDREKGEFVRVGEAKSRAEAFRDISPIYRVSPKSAPTLLVHGDRDFVVPLHHSQALEAKLRAAAVPVQLTVMKGKMHGWPGLHDDMALMAEWFDKHVTK